MSYLTDSPKSVNLITSLDTWTSIFTVFFPTVRTLFKKKFVIDGDVYEILGRHDVGVQ